MNTKIVTTFLLFISAYAATAQQDPLYSQYMFNMMGVNPAYAGNREVLSVTGMVRSQWVGVKGAPVSKLLTSDFAIKDKKVGLGFELYNDQIGIFNTTGLNVSYAYRLKFRTGTLAMGLQGGFQVFKADYQDVQLGGDAYDVAFANNVTEFKPSLGAGVFYNTDRYYVGFSAPHLFHYRAYTSSDGKNEYYQQNHWHLMGGYVFEVDHEIVVKPSFLVRMVKGAPITADINANIWFHNTISLGVSVRTSKMIVGMLEMQVNRQMRFGYAYDWTYSGVAARGSHELMLRYEFGYEKKRMYSPRYF